MCYAPESTSAERESLSLFLFGDTRAAAQPSVQLGSTLPATVVSTPHAQDPATVPVPLAAKH